MQAFSAAVYLKIWEVAWATLEPWETFSSAVSLLSGANRRAPFQLQNALCVSMRSSNIPQHECVCVWVCILFGIWASIGEFRMRTNVIFNLHKYTAGMCLSVYVNDCTFGRVICHSAGGWSGKAIDCKLTGVVLSHTNHLYMKWHTRGVACSEH